MKVSVWDTYVKREDGKVMHFDILVPSGLQDKKAIYGFGQQYLSGKSFKAGELSAKECRFCHMEQATSEIEEQISKQGYSIIEMENCL